ncbi:MAG: class I SAM-dependent methyltransferase [Verrucomicrobiota bacterium]
MNQTDVATAYDVLAEHWDSDQFNRQNGISAHERALQFLKVRKRAIDIGCGCSGRFLDWFLQEGFVPEGLDFSSEMLQRARRRHPDVLFHEADVRDWVPAMQYDFVSAWDSVWHLPQMDQLTVYGKLVESLRPGGVLLTSAGGLDEPGESVGEFMEKPLFHATPGVPALLATFAKSGALIRHFEFDQFPEKHLCIIVQKPDL